MAKSKVYLITYSLPNIFRIGPVRFIPGLNYLTQEQWDAIKDHPLLPARFELEHLVWVEGRSPEDYEEDLEVELESSDDEQSSGEDGHKKVAVSALVSTKKVKQAKELVRNTFDLELLEAWKEDETRSTVLQEIDEQIQKIHSHAKED